MLSNLVNTTDWPNLGQRRRRWPNIKSELGPRVAYAGRLSHHIKLTCLVLDIVWYISLKYLWDSHMSRPFVHAIISGLSYYNFVWINVLLIKDPGWFDFALTLTWPWCCMLLQISTRLFFVINRYEVYLQIHQLKGSGWGQNHQTIGDFILAY